MVRWVSLAGVIATGAVLAMGAFAAAEKPATVTAGQEDPMLDGGFIPKALSESDPTPIALHVSSRIMTPDGGPPPPLRELVIETDKAGAINLEGLPTCGPLVQNGRDIRKDCKSAVIGAGRARFLIAFPEAPVVVAEGKLTIFNGLVGPRSATLYALADLGGPDPGSVIAKVEITKIHAGRYGTKAVVSIPKVAGESGSISSFEATIFRKFVYKGQTKSVLTLTCRDGKVLARSHWVFEDGVESDAQTVRPCTGRDTGSRVRVRSGARRAMH
jgi:hypothetical protein